MFSPRWVKSEAWLMKAVRPRRPLCCAQPRSLEGVCFGSVAAAELDAPRQSHAGVSAVSASLTAWLLAGGGTAVAY